MRFIAPPLAPYDTLDMRRLDEIVEVGYRSALEAIPQWTDQWTEETDDGD